MVDIPAVVTSVNSKYTFDSPHRQYFTLPHSFICNITDHPSSSALGYQKLQKTCKYFFAKTKIVVLNNHIYAMENSLFLYSSFSKKRIYLPLRKFKYWVNYCSFYDKNFITFSPNIYQCKEANLFIEKQDLTLNELNFLNPSQKYNIVSFQNVTIKDSNGFPVTLDIVLERIKNFKRFYYENKCEIFVLKTFEKMLSVKLSQKFQRFYLFVTKNTDNEINEELIREFLKKNAAYLGIFYLQQNQNTKKFINLL